MFGTNREQIKNGQTVDIIESDSLGLRIEVARQGAELISLQKRDASGEWRPFLWRDGDLSGKGAGWTGHSTVMGYYIHRLLNQQSDYAGDRIEGGNHGQIRQYKFGPPHFSSDSGTHLTYHMGHHEYSKTDYPRKVDFALTYRLYHEELEVEFCFDNREHDRPAHVQFGLHPGFQVTSTTDVKGVQLLAPEGTYIRHMAPGNFLSGETEEWAHPGGALDFERSALEDSYLLEITDLAEEHRVFELCDRRAGQGVAIDCGSAPYLTLWSNHENFLCIEPCWGLPDHHDQRPFQEKAGIQRIEAHSQLKASCGLRPFFL